MDIRTQAKRIVIGDISDAWAVGMHDKNKQPMLLDGFTCKVSVVDSDNSELVNPQSVIAREVTQKDDKDNFLVYFMDDETNLFIPEQYYVAVIQLENLSLEKPIKKEIRRRFQAVVGLIV